MIVQKEIDREEVQEIANEILGGLTQGIVDINAELLDHEGRIQALESDNPEALRSLTDVNMTLNAGEDQKVVYYNFAEDKFKLKVDASGVGDAPDAQNYTRSAGIWNLLSGTTEITTLNTDLGTAQGDITNLQTDLGTAQTDITNLQALFPQSLNDLSDVDLSVPPTLNQILKYNGTNFIAANESGGVTTLAGLSDVNLGTLANGDVLTYDLANSEWVNSGLSLTPATLEYFQIRTTSGTGQYGPNTTGEFGVSSALNVFGSAISGTNLIDTSHSSTIVQIVNGK